MNAEQTLPLGSERNVAIAMGLVLLLHAAAEVCNYADLSMFAATFVGSDRVFVGGFCRIRLTFRSTYYILIAE